MRRVLALAAALLAAPMAGAQAPVELTVNAVDVGFDPDRTVRIVSRELGGGRLRGCPAPGGVLYRDVRLTSGAGSTSLVPSAQCRFPQEYAAIQGGNEIVFQMPAAPSSLAALIVTEGETGPCTVSDHDRAPVSPSPGDCWIQRNRDTNPTSYELRGRADNEWRQLGGGGAGGGAIADGSVTLQKIASSVRTRWDGAVKIVADVTPSLNGRAIEFLSVNESVTRSVDLPGVTVEDQGQRQGNVAEVHTLNFTGDGVTCEVSGTRSTCTVTGGVSDYADLTGRPDARFAELEEFEETLRTSADIPTNPHSVSVSSLNTWTAVGTVTLPATTPDRELVIVVEDVGEAALGRDRIDFDVLRASTRLATPQTTPGVGTEGVQFVQASPGNNRYWIGVTAANRLYFASDEAGNYRLTLSHSGPDVTPHLMPCPDGEIYKWTSGLAGCAPDAVGQPGSGEANPAAASLGEAQGGSLSALRSWSPLRVRQAALASVLAQARTGNADRWPASKLVYATLQGADGIVSTNDLQKLNGIEAGAEVNVVPDWEATSGDGRILNKPTTITSAQGTKLGLYPNGCPTGQRLSGTGTGAAFGCAADATGGGGNGGSFTPTKANIYPAVSEILVAGDGVQLATDATKTEITVTAGVLSVTSLPPSPHVGERRRLTVSETVQRDKTLIYNEAASSATVLRYDFADPPSSGPQFLLAYSLGHTEAALRNTLYVVTAGSYTMPADFELVLYRPGAQRTTYAVSDTARSAQFPHWFLVQGGATFATVSDSAYTYFANWEVGGAMHYPAVTIPPGDYTFSGGNAGLDGWTPTRGIAASWAQEGNTDRIPRGKLPREGFLPLISGPGTGVSVTNSSQDSFLPSLNTFDETFDLDDALNGAAILDIVGEWTLTSANTAIGFNSSSTAGNALRTISFGGRIGSSTVAASATYDGSTNRGVKVPGTEFAVYNGSAILGRVALYLGDDAGNLMGYVSGYTGASGSIAFAIAPSTFTLEVEHSDIGPAATTFTELEDTPPALGAAGQHVVVAASGTALAFAPAPTGGGSSYTSHTSLSTLPSSGMTVGDLHVVTEGTGVDAMVTRFFATSPTQLKCVGGISEDLVNLDFGSPASGGGQEVSVPTAQVWHRLPVAGQTGQFHTWDYRFSQFLIVTGGVNNTSIPWFNDRTWKIIDGAAVRGVTAGTSGGSATAAQSVEVLTRYGANASTEWKRVRFGRTANHQILVAIDDTAKQVFPLRIRGSCG